MEQSRPAFVDVDADDADGLVAMMDATDAWPAVRDARAWVLDHIQPGSLVVDVGCGPGTFASMARARGARTVDLDRSAAMLGAVRRRASEATVVLGEIGRLPIRREAADLVHVERVLQWTPDPDAAIDELRQSVAPGGWLAITDTDWGTFVLDHPDPAAGARIAEAARRWVPHPGLARMLPRRLAQLGGAEVAVRADAVVIGAWDPDDPAQAQAQGPPGLPLRLMAAAAPAAERRWVEAEVDRLADLGRQGSFFACLTLVTVMSRW